MAARHSTYCVVCGALLGHLWMGQRHRIPDYLCPPCFKTYECTPTGEIIRHRDLPAWLRYLKGVESTRRSRKRYWEQRGYQWEPITVAELNYERGLEDVMGQGERVA